MHDIDAELKEVMSMVQLSGGQIHVDQDAPDHVKRAFLDMIHKCPECQELFKNAKNKGA